MVKDIITTTEVQNAADDQNTAEVNHPTTEQAPQPINYPQRLSYRTILIIAVIAICFLGIFNRDLWTPDAALIVISSFGTPQIIAGIGLILCLDLILGRRKIDPVFRFAAVTAISIFLPSPAPCWQLIRPKVWNLK